MDPDTLITLPVWWLPILIGAVTPWLTGLIVKAEASKATKGWVATALVAAGTVLGSIIETNGQFLVRDIITTFVIALVTHQGTYGVEKALGNGVHPMLKAVPGGVVGPTVPPEELPRAV
jgi:hypothetical protein